MKDYLIYKNQVEKIISNVEAQVCVSFYDLDLKKSFSINGDKKVLSASLIKILIMATVMKNIKENTLSLKNGGIRVEKLHNLYSWRSKDYYGQCNNKNVWYFLYRF